MEKEPRIEDGPGDGENIGIRNRWSPPPPITAQSPPTTFPSLLIWYVPGEEPPRGFPGEFISDLDGG